MGFDAKQTRAASRSGPFGGCKISFLFPKLKWADSRLQKIKMQTEKERFRKPKDQKKLACFGLARNRTFKNDNKILSSASLFYSNFFNSSMSGNACFNFSGISSEVLYVATPNGLS